MTTDTNTLEVRQPLRGISWQRVLIGTAIGIVALVLIAAIVAFGYASLNAGRVLPGVTVGGVAVSGLAPAEAEQLLRAELPDVGAGSLQLHIGGIDHEVPYAEIGREYDMDTMLNQAMGIGRAGNPLDQLANQLRGMFGTVELTPIVIFNTELLTSRAASIAHAAQVTPTNASITYENGEYVVTPGVDGRSVNVDDVVAQSVAAVSAATVGDSSVTVEPRIIPADIATPAAQAAVDRARLVSASELLLTSGLQSSTIAVETLREWVRLEETAPGTWELMIDRAAVDQYVASLKAQTDRPAVEASLTFEGVDPVVSPSQVGAELDATAAGDAIVAALISRGEGGDAPQVALAVAPIEPEFTTEDAQALVGQVELLGSWTTTYVPSARNFSGINIRRPTELIDGTIIQPGEEFDFVDVAGPITRGNGYGDGAAIIGGNTRDEGVLGGGLCSASTTIYNAALRAGFELGARRNHAYYIDRYPVGLDATIWISGSYVQTVEFVNDSGYPIVIRGINARRKVTYEIWGVSDGRTVNLSQADVQNRREAKNYYEFTDDLAPRQTERDEYAADGFTSSVTRTVRDASGNVIHEDVIRSNYRRVDGIVKVGRMAGDPPAGTRIPFSQGLPPAPNPTDPPGPNPTDPPSTADPVAKFGVSLLENRRVAFSDNSTGGPTSWSWDFGDGASSSQRNPTHKYATPGSYTVTLTVTNDNGSSQRTKTITIQGGGPNPTDPPTPPSPTEPPEGG